MAAPQGYLPRAGIAMLKSLFLATGLTAPTLGVAWSQTAVKIGMLNDRSGV